MALFFKTPNRRQLVFNVENTAGYTPAEHQQVIEDLAKITETPQHGASNNTGCTFDLQVTINEPETVKIKSYYYFNTKVGAATVLLQVFFDDVGPQLYIFC